MPADVTLIQTASWPGVLAVASCQGSIVHGITPSVFTIRTYPQTAIPVEFGDLVISDGVNPPVTLADCHAFLIDGEATGEGQTWTIHIHDRRWRWRNQFGGFGGISGRYNQLDRRGKLVPWSIRSPEELARLCLDAMGETNYEIDLPAGLTKADGANLDRYLTLGENFPQTSTNPEINWDHTPPAEALASLCDQFGRRVVYQPNEDRVVIAQAGVGDPLPDTVPAEAIAPSIEVPEAPAFVGVYGAPVRIQARFALEAVGEEWDGSFLPIDQLSYAPAPRTVTTLGLTIPVGETRWAATNPPLFSNVRPTSRLAYTEAQAKAQATVFRYYRVRNVDPCTLAAPLTLPWYGKVRRIQDVIIQPTKVEQVIPQPRIPGGNNYGGIAPNGQGILPEFYNGRSRDQKATVTGAVAKYKQTVLWSPLGGLNTTTAQRVFVDFDVITTDTGDQIVVFAEHVFEYDPAGRFGYIKYPTLTLETSCLVVNPDTGQLVRWEEVAAIDGGTAPTEWHKHEDVQVGIVGEYETWSNYPAPTFGSQQAAGVTGDELLPLPDGQIHKLKGWHYAVGDLEHARPAAASYLAGHAAKYRVTGSEARQMIGIIPLDPDGFRQQVSWSVGPAGPTTVAAGNNEIHAYILPYPARRRAELLPPNKLAAEQNAAERAIVDRVFPQAGSAVK